MFDAKQQHSEKGGNKKFDIDNPAHVYFLQVPNNLRSSLQMIRSLPLIGRIVSGYEDNGHLD